jgi:hypothetical protein
MGEYSDDMAYQGLAAGMTYGFVFDPPHGPPHRCPGCQPRPKSAADAERWDRWHAIDAKWRPRGEPSACPVIRGEALPVPQKIEAPRPPAPIAVAEATTAPAQEPSADEKPNKARKPRASRKAAVPEGQGSLGF